MERQDSKDGAICPSLFVFYCVNTKVLKTNTVVVQEFRSFVNF